MTDARNRPDSKNATDRWLTPPEIIEVLGPFDLDPACEAVMPWRTAKVMVALPFNGTLSFPPESVGADVAACGLEIEWRGRVWLNPPWSDPLPWALKIAAHANGVWLSSGKSPDTKWAQIILCSADAVLLPAGRPLFHYPDGTRSAGKWTPIMLAAWGEENVNALRRISQYQKSILPGPMFVRTGP